MHIPTANHHLLSLNSYSDGSFLFSCLLLHELEDVNQILYDACLKLKSSILDKPTGLEDYPQYAINAFDPLELYRMTIWVHERRHFQDFVGSCFAFYFLHFASMRRTAVRLLLSEAKKNGIRLSFPLSKNKDEIERAFGKSAWMLLDFPETFISIHFDPNRAVLNNVTEAMLADIICMIDNSPFPPIVCLKRDNSLVPLKIVDIMEASAILSQLQFISSSFGEEKCKSLWNFIRTESISSKHLEYVYVLDALMTIFGEDVFFNLDTLRAIRKGFRFCLNGTIIGYIPQHGNQRKHLLNSPTHRFYGLFIEIMEQSAQTDFIKSPHTYIKNYGTSFSRQMPNFYDNYKELLSGHMSDYEALHKTYKTALETDIMVQLFKYTFTGLEQDTEEIDKYLDMLWPEDYIPKMLDCPIQLVYSRRLNKWAVLTEDAIGKGNLWLFLMIMESITSQALHKETVNCHFTRTNICERKVKDKEDISVFECKYECPVTNIVTYVYNN